MITVAEDPRGKLPKEFSICASFYRSHHFWHLVENNMKIFLRLWISIKIDIYPDIDLDIDSLFFV